MADEKTPPETPNPPVAAQEPAKEASDRKITDNPGEGSHMFSDWALI
ncbi:MAG: hypothetical protein AAF761_04160 [Pseudomonadota bacterium]